MSDDQNNMAVRLGVLEHRANEGDRIIASIQRSTAEISASLSALVRLEEQHAETRRALERAFNALKDADQRMEKVENEMPTLRLVQKWVFATVSGLAVMAGLLVWKLVA